MTFAALPGPLALAAALLIGLLLGLAASRRRGSHRLQRAAGTASWPFLLALLAGLGSRSTTASPASAAETLAYTAAAVAASLLVAMLIVRSRGRR